MIQDVSIQFRESFAAPGPSAALPVGGEMNTVRMFLALLALLGLAVMPAQAGVPKYILAEEFGYIT